MDDLRQKNQKKANRILLCLVIGIIVLIGLAIASTVGMSKNYKLEEISPTSTKEIRNGGVKQDFIVDGSLPQNCSLAFFSSHQIIELYADENLIYELKDTAGVWGRSTGNQWNFVNIPIGTKQLTVRIIPCYPEIAGYETTYYIGEGREIYTAIIRNAIPAFVVCVFILIVGMYIFGYWFIASKSACIDGTMLYLGVFSLLLGAWSINETNIFALIVRNHQASTFAAFLLLMAMPIPFSMFVRNFLDIGDNKIWRALCNICLFEIVACTTLHFSGIRDYRQTLTLTHLTIAAALLYLIYAICYKLVKKQADKRLKVCILALGMVIVTCFGDIAKFYHSSIDSGVMTRAAFLLFIVILGIESAMQTVAILKRGQRAQELEAFALNDTMTGFYNRNAYDYYVKQKKKKPDSMVVVFDLNDLKKCNDNYGHGMGDLYITQAAHIIERVFYKQGKCYRIGGDEFCCIISPASSCNIQRLIQKLRQEVDLLNNKNIIPTKVNIACGYASFCEEDSDYEQVRARADEMMYQDKKNLKLDN